MSDPPAMSPDALPPIQVAVLDPATLDQLLFDIGAAAELVEIVVKGGGELHAEAGPGRLTEARDALLSRRVIGLQLRYRHAGREWWDTLMHTEGGIRLVRIDHTAALAQRHRDDVPLDRPT